ncbi:hypothetical protein BDP27DRAFT_1400877 [Rhodocollybia butyracea]|uniref:F-box domain-containing protein n=1 Tax=Rhodocollybia butyracea TaxID=206335 RepID=A0A9P5U9Y1_9AGAR|nr:hypothetical protein BDP27DRAFT_1400877 [Rhodocollybia butyracea]
MSLKFLVDILPFTRSSDEPPFPSYESSTTNTLRSGVRYIQRTLLKFNRSNPHASLVATSLECPADYLPVELLREIFMFSLPDDNWTHPLNASDPHTPYLPPQYVISQVCSRWRNVAVSFPELWSTFGLESLVPHHVTMVKLWMERSRQLPLTLYINNERCHTLEEACTSTTVTADVINLLRPHVHRWKSVTFKLSSHCHPSTNVDVLPPGSLSLLESFGGLPLDRCSLLEKVHFEVDDIQFARWHEGIEQIGEMFLSSPQLKEFGWKTHYRFRAPFSPSLTHLSGDFVLDTTFLESLAELKNLHYLRLDGTCKWRVSDGEHLELRFWKDIFLSPFVNSLSELNVDSDNADPVLTMLSRSNPDRPILPLLSRFWLSTRKCSIGHLYDMLEHRIHHFRPLSGPSISEGLFDGIQCYGSIRPPAAGRSLFIQSIHIQVNDSRNRAQLDNLIERNACGHVDIVPTSAIKEEGNLLFHLQQGFYTGDTDE